MMSMSHPGRPALRRLSLTAAAGAALLAGCGGGSGDTGDSIDIASCALGQQVQPEAVGGGGQSGTVGVALAAPLQVRLSCLTPATINGDASLQRVRNGDIVWTVTAGAGTVNGAASASTVTDNTGIASAAWTLGALSGVQTVEARLVTNLPGIPSVTQTFSANAQ
jgi:hypothetical protein